MKRNPQESMTRDRMAPGVLSRDGFLGGDTRSLQEIIAADAAELASAGITATEVAAAIDCLHAAADEALESEATLAGGAITVRLTEVMGRIPCPFACGHRSHKATLEVTCEGRTLLLTPLHAHLIREHGFFQGRGAAFRVAPADLAAITRILSADMP